MSTRNEAQLLNDLAERFYFMATGKRKPVDVRNKEEALLREFSEVSRDFWKKEITRNKGGWKSLYDESLKTRDELKEKLAIVENSLLKVSYQLAHCQNKTNRK